MALPQPAEAHWDPLERTTTNTVERGRAIGCAGRSGSMPSISTEGWAVVLWMTALSITAFLTQANYDALLNRPERAFVLLALLVLLVALLSAGYRLWTRNASP